LDDDEIVIASKGNFFDENLSKSKLFYALEREIIDDFQEFNKLEPSSHFFFWPFNNVLHFIDFLVDIDLRILCINFLFFFFLFIF
jgi:hypothetical protein